MTVSCHLLVSGVNLASLTSGTLPCPVSSHGHQLGSAKTCQESSRGVWGGSRTPAPCPSGVQRPFVEAVSTKMVRRGGSVRALAAPEAGVLLPFPLAGDPGKGALGRGGTTNLSRFSKTSRAKPRSLRTERCCSCSLLANPAISGSGEASGPPGDGGAASLWTTSEQQQDLRESQACFLQRHPLKQVAEA